MVNIMNIKACSVTISRWETAHPKCSSNCQIPTIAIRTKNLFAGKQVAEQPQRH